MRHKYRAWDKIDKLMYYDIHRGIKFDDGSEYSFADFLDNKGYHEWVIMQFTGLRDKKRTDEYPEGQEEYEGDIICNEDGAIRVIEQSGNRGLRLKSPTGWCYEFFGSHPEDYEVIGSIHSNPELIENGTE